MNIAVITPFDYPNVGAYLQAYCLKTKLEELGHTVYHIPTQDKDFVYHLYFNEKPTRKKEMLFRITFEKRKRFGKRKYVQFGRDIAEFKTVGIGEKPMDLYIVGSDEIWNLTHMLANTQVFIKPMFWGLGIDPVISYAASIGNADVNTLMQYPDQIAGIRKLGTALVRDKKTAEFVRTATGREAPIVCDPTMLVPVERYGREFEDDYLKKHDCLLVYAYTTIDKMSVAAIKAYAKRHKLKLVGCCFYHTWCDHTCECTPLEFSSLIRQCKAVVTNTFHGSIFSMLNHANFVSISFSQKTNQLLEQFDLSDRCLKKGEVTEESIARALDGAAIDYAAVERKINEIRSNSVGLLTQAIDSAVGTEGYDYRICPSDECSACFACRNKCPKDAIKVVTDIYGRTLPVIDPDLCIRCGVCKKVCPQNNPVELNQPLKCYAAVRKDEEAHKKSTSGGIGAVLCESILADGGVVYGAAFENDGELILKHSKASDKAQADRFRGSKYVQSYIGEIYRDVLDELKNGRKVLFTGTPCQVGGLRSYLGREYEHLYCADLVCHGVPLMKHLNQHLKNAVGDQTITDVTFRTPGGKYVLTAFSGDTVVHRITRDMDPYYRSFIASLNIRKNCYSCRYAAGERCGDLTIGDFWGLDRSSLKTPMTGNISLVLANTEQGLSLLSRVSQEITTEERSFDEALPKNPNLREPSAQHKDTNRFLEAYRKTQDFDKAVNATCIQEEIKGYSFSRTTLPGRVIGKIKHVLKNGKWK